MGFSKSNTITGASGQAPEFLCEHGAEINQVKAEAYIKFVVQKPIYSEYIKLCCGCETFQQSHKIN